MTVLCIRKVKISVYQINEVVRTRYDFNILEDKVIRTHRTLFFSRKNKLQNRFGRLHLKIK